MVYACMNPYRDMHLLKPAEVRDLKDMFGNEIRVLGGCDFGSGKKGGATVPSVVINWRKSGRYQLAWIEKRPQEHGLDQCRYLAELFGSSGYNCDLAVGDLGYGQDRVKIIQDGGRDSKDVKFTGVGKRRFKGCRSIGDPTKPQQEYKLEVDEHGEQLGRFQIDKTTSVQKFVDFIGWYVAHPLYPETKVPKFMIPYPTDTPWETDWLVDEFCGIVRADIEQDPDIVKDDRRQFAKKEFLHPPDAVMSIIYTLTADEHYDEDAYKMLGVGKK